MNDHFVVFLQDLGKTSEKCKICAESVESLYRAVMEGKTKPKDYDADDFETTGADSDKEEDNSKSADGEMDVKIQAQPDGITCGPTSLNAIYSYLGVDIPVSKLRNDIEILNSESGTMASVLGLDALKRGLKATIHTYDMRIVDPTWKDLGNDEIKAKLTERKKYVKDSEINKEIDKVIKFIDLGGNVVIDTLDKDTFTKYFDKNVPVICELSFTYLYGTPREGSDGDYDDVKGSPSGHFLIAYGFDDDGKIKVSDPFEKNPVDTKYVSVDFLKFCNAIMLGTPNVMAIENPE